MKKILALMICFITLILFYSPINAQYDDSRRVGNVLYVSPQGYLDNKKFSPIYKSMSDAFKVVKRGDVIKIYGKLRESGLSTPKDITDVTILGMGTKVRPGNSTTPNGVLGGSADWSKNSEADNNPLLIITAAGWTIQNLHFGGKGSSIVLERNGNDKSANHTIIINNVFSGGKIGIEDHGGSASVNISNNLFYGYDTAIASTNTSQALPLMWEIINNRFIENSTHIKLPLSNSVIKNNSFFSMGFISRNKVSVDLSGGKNNIITENNMGHPSNLKGYVNSAYKSGSDDAWGPNYFTDKVGFGLPKE